MSSQGLRCVPVVVVLGVGLAGVEGATSACDVGAAATGACWFKLASWLSAAETLAAAWLGLTGVLNKPIGRV